MSSKRVLFGDVVGDRIETMRKRHGLTQLAVAEALGLSATAYGEKCWNRRNHWRLDDLPRLQEYFERWEKMPMPGWPVLDEPYAKALGGLVGIARITGPHVSGGTPLDPETAFIALRALLSGPSASPADRSDPTWGSGRVD